MYTEDNYIQLSALQHYIFCPRQCAFIHVYGLWEENALTAKGQVFHERVDSNEDETRGEVRYERGLYISSARLGLSGRADLVEFRSGTDGNKIPYPVEYKVGKPKIDHCDKVQLCAQALCLEEMLDVSIPSGALYYGKTRHREDVTLDDQLRSETEDVIRLVHAIVDERRLPEAEYDKKCLSCSLYDHCMPCSGGSSRLKSYMKELYTP